MLRERHENVSLVTENRLRVALGLEPIKTYEAEACPDCGLVHTGRCYGRGPNAQVVVIDPRTEYIARRRSRTHRHMRASISIPAELRDRLNQARKAAGKSWEEFLRELLHPSSEDRL